jgi:hypothetical protein
MTVTEPRPPLPRQLPDAHDAASADLRAQVVDRLRLMNALHTQHAWYRRHSQPIGPHGLAFFYAEPGQREPVRFTLRTATRLFLDGPDVSDAPRLLYEICGIAAGYAQQGRIDPRTQMADRCEPMAASATFVGVGLSTLDTHSGSWAQVRGQASGPLDIPGRGLAVLADETRVLIDRRGRDEYSAFHVQATHSLDVVPGQPALRWRWNPDLAERSDAAIRDVWHFLAHLGAVIHEAGVRHDR